MNNSAEVAYGGTTIEEKPKVEPIQEVQWHSVAAGDMPPMSGRYWCHCTEQNDLGLSVFQWNCYWNGVDAWTDGGLPYRVTHWTELLKKPSID